ncbi:MAG: RagB/SusD family nutrient uptake outer membrane protein [Chitinophagaceae bacterium]
MKKYYIFLSAVLVLAGTSCKKKFYDEDVVIDPNGATVESVLTNATRGQVGQLAIGVQSSIRNGVVSYYREAGTVGREIIYSASTDNRYFTELLGTQASQFSGTNDPVGIFNGYYTSYSSLRRRALILQRSAEGAAGLSAQEKSATKGFAKTIDAYASWVLVNMQGKNGIRESFTDLLTPGDLLKPGKFGTYESGLALAKKLADEGFADLNAGGTAFPFTMTSGWAGFSDVAGFKKFNRAMAARIALYQKNWAGVLSALSESFLDLNGSLQTGPKMTFSTTANDQTNGLFHSPNSSGSPFVVFNEFVTQAEAGDTRVFGAAAKVGQRTNARTSGAITSTHEVRMYPTNTSSISIIRNEELILMYAEAKVQLSAFADAVTALDKIRTTYGLRPLAIAKPTILANKDALIDEVLNQRRYSLFFEGQRWFDALRYNKKSILPLQGAVGGNTFVVFDNLARPDAEVQWDRQNP